MHFLHSYHAQGICNFGDHCIYSHDSENSIPIPDDVCLFYLRSNCINGDECTKAHKSITELVGASNVTEAAPNDNDCAFFVEDGSPNETFNDGASVFPAPITISKYETSKDEQDQEGDLTASEASKSYASVASSSQPKDDNEKSMATKELCSFYESNGFCITPKCNNVHGNWCDLCGFYCLHPFNDTQRDRHRMVRKSPYFR